MGFCFSMIFFIFEKELKQLLQLVLRGNNWNRKAHLAFAASASLTSQRNSSFAALLLEEATTWIWQWGVSSVRVTVLGPIILGQASFLILVNKQGSQNENLRGRRKWFCQQRITHLWSAYVCLWSVAYTHTVGSSL